MENEDKLNIILNTEEYKSLREEVMEWQRRRFIIANIAIVFTVTFMTFVIEKNLPISFSLSATIPTLLLSVSCFLTSLFGRFSTVIGVYLEIFHEGAKWNGRLREFKKKRKLLELNNGFSAVYIIVWVVTLLLLYSFRYNKSSESILETTIFIFSISLFIAGIISLKLSYPRKEYHKIWLAIFNSENKQHSQRLSPTASLPENGG